jgi:hypothetical protein
LTAEDPARRPPSATEVERELEAMTDGGSEAAARLAVAWRRRRRVGGILGLAAAAVVIAAAGMTARAQRERTGQLPGGGALILRIPEPVLAAGESSRAIATRFSPDGSTTGMVPTTWWSSDTRVAVVDSKGKVTAKGPGTATITAFLGKTSATDSVTVPPPGWELVSSSSLAPPPPGSLVVMPGETRTPTSSFAFGRGAWVQVSIDWLSVLELIPFCGVLPAVGGGFHDATSIQTAVPGRVSGEDGRSRSSGPDAEEFVEGVQRLGADDLVVGPAGRPRQWSPE